jgi:hypothetical protein
MRIKRAHARGACDMSHFSRAALHPSIVHNVTAKPRTSTHKILSNLFPRPCNIIYLALTTSLSPLTAHLLTDFKIQPGLTR